LKNLVRRAITICSTDTKLQAEIIHLQNAFTEINDYPFTLVKTIIEEEVSKHQQQPEVRDNESNEDTNEEADNTNEEIAQINLPYAGKTWRGSCEEAKTID